MEGDARLSRIEAAPSARGEEARGRAGGRSVWAAECMQTYAKLIGNIFFEKVSKKIRLKKSLFFFSSEKIYDFH